MNKYENVKVAKEDERYVADYQEGYDDALNEVKASLEEAGYEYDENMPIGNNIGSAMLGDYAKGFNRGYESGHCEGFQKGYCKGIEDFYEGYLEFECPNHKDCNDDCDYTCFKCYKKWFDKEKR